MAGPTNGIMGDEDYGTSLPQSEVNNDALAEPRKAAKFSRTAEFKRLRDHIEAKIAHYQANMPDGTPVVLAKQEEAISQWKIANVVIAEFKEILDYYDKSAELVKEDNGSTARQ